MLQLSLCDSGYLRIVVRGFIDLHEVGFVYNRRTQQSSSLALYSFARQLGSIADSEHGTLIDIVNTIRNNQNDFAEWHARKTAELYSQAFLRAFSASGE